MNTSHTCIACRSPFSVTDDERAIIGKVAPVLGGKTVDIPGPTRCPDCRFRRRLAHHNERRLYRRKCAKTGNDIISIYSPEKDLVVYDVREWWKDTWDGLDYGRAVDFSRPFFPQLSELRTVVPRMSVMQENAENSLFTSSISNLKNCYLLFTSDFSQNCGYGTWTQNSRDCYDNAMIDKCELCYECIFCSEVYRSAFVRQSSQCSDSMFLFDCRNCSNCFLSHGLRNKQYHIQNVPYSKEEYFRKLAEFPVSSATNLAQCQALYEDMVKKAIHLYIWRKGTILRSSGDLLADCDHCVSCFECMRSKDCMYSLGYEMKDALDCTYANAELGYENCECFPMPYHSAFNVNSYTGSNLYYCDLCMSNCSDCFGCVGLKHKKFCILNVQYTESEYADLATKLILHMKSAKEWGEFFPIEMSNFLYNESLAHDYFPITEDEAAKAGYGWLRSNPREDVPASMEIPDDIADVGDEITDAVLACDECKKNYRVISQEIAFYRTMGLPVPRRCFECRNAARRHAKNPRRLFTRPCSKCGETLESAYSADRPEAVYCESCYLQTVY